MLLWVSNCVEAVIIVFIFLYVGIYHAASAGSEYRNNASNRRDSGVWYHHPSVSKEHIVLTIVSVEQDIITPIQCCIEIGCGGVTPLHVTALKTLSYQWIEQAVLPGIGTATAILHYS